MESMKRQFILACLCWGILAATTAMLAVCPAQAAAARNPIIHADVPDIAMIRVGDTYYMSSTTMHMSPGLPIMKSKDLVNWELVGYAYDTLEDNDALNLAKRQERLRPRVMGQQPALPPGHVLSSRRFPAPPARRYIYTTKDIEKGPWTGNTPSGPRCTITRCSSTTTAAFTCSTAAAICGWSN